MRKALEAGADPNARKQVTLKVTLDPAGEKVEDTQPMESALTLAYPERRDRAEAG